jgi:hypothetical protein
MAAPPEFKADHVQLRWHLALEFALSNVPDVGLGTPALLTTAPANTNSSCAHDFSHYTLDPPIPREVDASHLSWKLPIHVFVLDRQQQLEETTWGEGEEKRREEKRRKTPPSRGLSHVPRHWFLEARFLWTSISHGLLGTSCVPNLGRPRARKESKKKRKTEYRKEKKEHTREE